MQHKVPISTVDLIPLIDQLLVDLLSTLEPLQWSLQTLAPRWSVKDVVAHLLDGNIRNLSASRDHYFGGGQPASQDYNDVVSFLNKINQEGVEAAQKISPGLLIELIGFTNRLFSEHLKTLDLFEKSIFPVSWAGEAESQNWFDIARQYTEKWHHQQQIRSAIGEEEILFFPLYFTPYLQTSLMAWPHHFRDIPAQHGDTILLNIDSNGGGCWYLIYDHQKWLVSSQPSANIVCTVDIPAKLAWRMFSKEISKHELKVGVRIEGKKELADKLLSIVAVMA